MGSRLSDTREELGTARDIHREPGAQAVEGLACQLPTRSSPLCRVKYPILLEVIACTDKLTTYVASHPGLRGK
jgi:hypothetical protein